LRAELMYTLTLPFVGPYNAGKELEREGSETDIGADEASERSFLTAYGTHAAELLGRVSAAMAGEAGGREHPSAASAQERPGERAWSEPTAQARVRAGVAAVLEFCADEPDDARSTFVEALSVGPAARERRSQTTLRLAELFEQPLRELRPTERIARVSAIALVGGMLELLFDPVDRLAVDELPALETIVAAARLEPDPQR